MSKKKFVEYVNRFVNSQKISNNAGVDPKWACNLQELLIHDLLRELSNGKKETDWVGFWIYELKGGKKYKKGMVQDEYGEEIKLKTVDDLYEVVKNERRGTKWSLSL